MWSLVPVVAETMDARPLIRRAARASGMGGSAANPFPDHLFIDAVTALGPRHMRQFSIALSNANNHYHSQSDCIGSAGIPVFLGLFALGTVTEETIPIMIAGVFAYLIMFLYLRTAAGIAGAYADAVTRLVGDIPLGSSRFADPSWLAQEERAATPGGV